MSIRINSISQGPFFFLQHFNKLFIFSFPQFLVTKSVLTYYIWQIIRRCQTSCYSEDIFVEKVERIETSLFLISFIIWGVFKAVIKRVGAFSADFHPV